MADYMDDEVEVQEPCTEVPESWTITIVESSDEEREESQVQPEMTHQEAVPDSDEEGETVVQISEQASGETLSEQRNRFAAQEALDIGVGWWTFRVPPHVREVEKGAYTPKIVSIGPSYHNKPSLRPFEVEKERFFSRLQHQMRRRGCEVDLEEAMKEMEEKTRKCYSVDFGGTESYDFFRMMLLDGCFIVELMRLYRMRTSEGNDRYIVEEPIFEKRWMLPNICRDLLLLENQLPMFVLQKIYEITTFDNEATDHPLNKLALRFFEQLKLGKGKLEDRVLNTNPQHPHLLALYHSTFTTPNDHPRPFPEGNSNNMSKYDKIPGKGWVDNATTLTNVGVQFKNKSGDFLDIEYKNGLLKIPTLFVDDGTSTLLRNLIAYEQSDGSATPYFSCLAVFLDSIVNTVDDINILRNAGIIKQLTGGNKEVVNLFNSLTKGVEIDIDDCYIIKQQIEDINSRRGWYKHVLRFRRILSLINFKSILSTYLSWLPVLLMMVFHAKRFPNGSLDQGGCIN